MNDSSSSTTSTVAQGSAIAIPSSARGALAHRQVQRERRPLALSRLYLDPSTVVVGDMAHDGETEASASGVAGPCPVDAVETFEDPIELARRDTDAAVADGQHHRVAVPLDPHLDRRSVVGVLD